jgi:hypothetical protein
MGGECQAWLGFSTPVRMEAWDGSRTARRLGRQAFADSTPAEGGMSRRIVRAAETPSLFVVIALRFQVVSAFIRVDLW